MNVFPVIELKSLLEEQRPSCTSVSIYMPAEKGGYQVQQNPIRLKNLVREAERRLEANGLRPPEARRLLEPVEKLFDDSAFWRKQSDGLAIFISDGLFRYYHLPYRFPELVVVGERLHIKPLIPVLTNDGRYYILALSHKSVRLLQCSHYGVRELDLTDIAPKGLPEFLKYEDLDRQLQFHVHGSTSAPGTADIGTADSKVSHGREVGEEDKINLLRYFQQLDQDLERELFRWETSPLVLAGVDYLIPLYRQANTYQNILAETIPGNVEDSNVDELHDRGWNVVQPHFEKARSQAFELYKELYGTKRASNDVAAIVPDAYYGRVQVLFVGMGTQAWGTFDPSSGAIELHEKAQPCDEDLLDMATAHTLANRGEVYAAEPEKLPGCLVAAAILRY